MRDCRYPRRLAPEPRRRHRRPRPEHYNGIVDRHTHDGEEVLAAAGRARTAWVGACTPDTRSVSSEVWWCGRGCTSGHEKRPWSHRTLEAGDAGGNGASAENRCCCGFRPPAGVQHCATECPRSPGSTCTWLGHACGEHRRRVSLSRQRPVHTSERTHPAIWGGSGPHARLRTSVLVMLQTTAEGLRKRYRAPPTTWWFHPRARV